MKRTRDTDELDKDITNVNDKKHHKEKRGGSLDETKLKGDLEKEKEKSKRKLDKLKKDKLKVICMEKEQQLSHISKIQKNDKDILRKEQEELDELKWER